jgi:hypothetical protein
MWNVIRGLDWRAFVDTVTILLLRGLFYGQLSKHQFLKKGLLRGVSTNI